jgi:hypothetical protein
MPIITQPMSSLNGDFMDAQNIVIINDVPHFSFKGNSYLEKLKNGLSLDYVFFMEDSSIRPDDNVEEKEEDYKQYQPLKHELFDEEYDVDVLPRPRKGKNIIKLRSVKNMKKNKVKQNGYNDKLHTIESNLPSIWCPDFEGNEYYDSDYMTYSNIPSDSDFEDFEDYLDYYGSAIFNRTYSFDSLDEWNNANHTGIGWD